MASRAEGFGPEVKRRIMLGTFALSAGYADQYYNQALKVRRLIRNDFDAAFREVDVLIGPTTPTAAFKLGEKTADPLAMYLSDIYTITTNLAGIPGISIPCGLTKSGLPIGLQLIAPAFAEDNLLRTARVFETATDWHTKRPELADEFGNRVRRSRLLPDTSSSRPGSGLARAETEADISHPGRRAIAASLSMLCPRSPTQALICQQLGLDSCLGLQNARPRRVDHLHRLARQNLTIPAIRCRSTGMCSQIQQKSLNVCDTVRNLDSTNQADRLDAPSTTLTMECCMALKTTLSRFAEAVHGSCADVASPKAGTATIMRSPARSIANTDRVYMRSSGPIDPSIDCDWSRGIRDQLSVASAHHAGHESCQSRRRAVRSAGPKFRRTIARMR